MAAERNYPGSEVRGCIRECQAAMVEEQLRGGIPSPRSGASAGRSYPTSKERWLRRHRRAQRSYSMLKVRRGSSEEIPLIQGKEQWLRFSGAAVKRYPSKMVGVARGHQRADTLKP